MCLRSSIHAVGVLASVATQSQVRRQAEWVDVLKNSEPRAAGERELQFGWLRGNALRLYQAESWLVQPLLYRGPNGIARVKARTAPQRAEMRQRDTRTRVHSREGRT